MLSFIASAESKIIGNRVLHQRLAKLSASTSAPSAMLDEEFGAETQSSSFGRDAEIREVKLSLQSKKE